MTTSNRPPRLTKPCRHRWQPTERPGFEKCSRCPAMCERGDDGMIVVFSADGFNQRTEEMRKEVPYER